jgi:endoplasmic reticulum Man9GlcNAc2 1,2-alpha-mannosidase
MGCDAYHPVSRAGSNLTYAGGIGYMVLDAIDSLILFGLDEEYQRAREWVASELSFDRDGVYSTFEVSLSRGRAGHASFLEITLPHG